MNIDLALNNMAIDMDKAGFSAKEITDAGHIMGAMASMIVDDIEAFNHFMSKIAIQYDMKYKPQTKKLETISRTSSIWSLQ